MKMESLGFSLSFSYFFLLHTLFQGSVKEKISSAEQNLSLLLAKALWVTAAAGTSPSGDLNRGEVLHPALISAVPYLLWAYNHVLYNSQ